MNNTDILLATVVSPDGFQRDNVVLTSREGHSSTEIRYLSSIIITYLAAGLKLESARLPPLPEINDGLAYRLSDFIPPDWTLEPLGLEDRAKLGRHWERLKSLGNDPRIEPKVIEYLNGPNQNPFLD